MSRNWNTSGCRTGLTEISGKCERCGLKILDAATADVLAIDFDNVIKNRTKLFQYPGYSSCDNIGLIHDFVFASDLVFSVNRILP